MISAATEFSRSGGSPGRGEKPAYTVPANLTVALPAPPLHRCAGSVHKKTRDACQCARVDTGSHARSQDLL